MTLRKLASPALLALLAACSADPVGFTAPRTADPYAAPTDDSGQLGSGNRTEAEEAAAPRIGSGAVHDGPLYGSGGFAPEDSAAATSAGPAFGSGVGFAQPPADAPADSIG